MNGPLLKSTPEQRADLYEDVETLLSPGFLSHPVVIEGVQLGLRSLGPGDVFLLRSRADHLSLAEWKAWMVASSVWLFNGYVLLEDPNFAPFLVNTLRGLPGVAQEILFHVVQGLFARTNRAIEATEFYCYERISRFRWRTFGHQHPASHAGIPGVAALGTNSVQRMWTFFNDVEDRRAADETLWEGFKLTTSAQAPKSIKKIDQRDRQHREEEENRRQAALDRFYYTQIGVLTDAVAPGKSATTKFSKSADDLEQEMYLWVTGQEDWHDQVVNDYKRRISEQYEQEKRARAARQKALQQAYEQEGFQKARPLVGYTPDQLAEILKQRGPGVPGVRQVALGPQGSKEYLYDKYLGQAPDAGKLAAQDGKLRVREGDLNAALAARQPVFRTEED